MHSQQDHDDAGWAFRVALHHGGAIRSPTDNAEFRRAVRRIARAHGVRIRTWEQNGDVCLALADEREARGRGTGPDAPGGWMWDERLRQPTLDPSP